GSYGGALFTGPQKQGSQEVSTTAKDGEYADTSVTNEKVRDFQSLFAHVVKKAEPAVVNISAIHLVEVQTPFHQFYFGDPLEQFFNEFFKRPKRKQSPEPEMEKFRHEGTGSGFIVDSEGYVITNYHVIRDAEEIKVTMYDDKKYNAKVIGKDPMTDLAVVKIKSMRKFDALKMGDSDLLEVGEWVVAAGSPFGLQQTYTAGIISAVRQDVNVENRAYRDLLQTDAAINQGNSGGPLLDLKGQVIGINTAIFAPTGVFSGIGFAIPINNAKKILEELIKRGEVIRAWIGVEIRDVDEAIKSQFSLKEANGVLINDVIPGTGAAVGGMQRGDIIITFNDEEIADVRSLQDKVSVTEPEKKVKIGVIREGKTKELVIELGRMPDVPSGPEEKTKSSKAPAQVRCEGMLVGNIDPVLKQRYNLTVSEGVVVIDIDPTQICYDMGLHIGDIVLEINRKKVKNVYDFEDIMSKTDMRKGVVFDIIRDGRPLYLSYRQSE
ncbi:Do family serine endopeptidase, partial [Elusimicrobiota bacterium]